MKILALGTSNNRFSINRLLAAHAASLLPSATVKTLDLNDFEMPLFSDEREQQLGIPVQARRFYRLIGEADALVLSFAEHNGSYTAAYKNLFDWTSRINKAVFQDKPAVYLATSPGPGGAASVLAGALQSAGYYGARVVASLSVPSFNENFDEDTGRISNPSIRQNLLSAMQLLHREVVQAELSRARLRAL
jgi:NAD(P)H-dependent FMN reductase